MYLVGLQSGLDSEAARPLRRSWFYRVFVAPFTDMDERAVYTQDQRRR
jgi:hypothetical protein